MADQYMQDALERQKNLKTIEYFLTLTGPDRGEKRKPLFTDDAKFQMKRPIDYVKNQGVWQLPVKEWLEVSVDISPIWGFYESMIYQCEDPHKFLVTAVGRGQRKKWAAARIDTSIQFTEDDKNDPVPAYTPYIIYFLMEDGKIKLFREIDNPCENPRELRDL